MHKGFFVKQIFPLLLLFIVSSTVSAKTVYVTDNVKLTLRSTENNRSKILKMLRSGTPLTLIKRNEVTGYSKVRLKNGIEGYILNTHTSNKPTSRWYLKIANKELALLQEENIHLKQELGAIKGENSEASSSQKSLSDERDQFRNELESLKQTATNAVQLKHQRDQLQERVVNVERELQQIKREKQALEDSTKQDWFLYGGMLSFIGIFLGLLLPKLSWQRKTSNWDTF